MTQPQPDPSEPTIAQVAAEALALVTRLDAELSGLRVRLRALAEWTQECHAERSREGIPQWQWLDDAIEALTPVPEPVRTTLKTITAALPLRRHSAMTDDDDTSLDLVTLPRDTITVAARSLDYVYRNINGEEAISLVVGTPNIGTIDVMLTPDGATHVGAHLHAMVADLPRLRQEWQKRQGGTGA